MSTAEQSESESEDTPSTEQTVEPEPDKELEPSGNGVFLWTKSVDLRILPLEVLLKKNNPELDPDTYYPAAQLISGNPLVHVFYGLDEERRIQTALFLTINMVDGCLYVSNYFDVDLQDPKIRAMIEEHAELFKAKAIKQMNASILYQKE